MSVARDGRVRADRAGHRPAGGRPDDAARPGRRRAPSWPPRTAGSWPPPTCWSRAGTSGATGRRPSTSGTGRRRANLADIAAMGAVPTALLVALCAPADLDVRWAEELADGLGAEAAKVGASVVGGDMSASPTLTIAVTALGDLRRPWRRCCAAGPGRATWSRWPGRLGYAAAGLHRAVPRLPDAQAARRGVPPAGGALRGRPGGGRGSAPPHDRRLRRAARRPRPRRHGQPGRRSTSTRTRSRCRSRCATPPRRWASTRTAGCWPAATTTRSWRPSRPGTTLPDGWRPIGRVADGAGRDRRRQAVQGPGRLGPLPVSEANRNSWLGR